MCNWKRVDHYLVMSYGLFLILLIYSLIFLLFDIRYGIELEFEKFAHFYLLKAHFFVLIK